MKTCSVKECNNKIHAKEICQKHYRRVERNDDLNIKDIRRDSELTKTQRFNLSYTICNKSGCWIWKWRLNKDGYGMMNWNNKNTFAHRVSYEINNDICPGNLSVCHHCDNPSCVNPSHLFLGTQKDNVQDMMSKSRNRPLQGSNHPNSKINEETAQLIFKQLKDGLSPTLIAKKLSVSRDIVYSLKYGVGWKHLK